MRFSILQLAAIFFGSAAVACACELTDPNACCEARAADEDLGVNQLSVAIFQFQFLPQDVVIPRGAAVRWTNFDSSLHTATSDAVPPVWDSGYLAEPEAYTFNFGIPPGNYPYICLAHPDMIGSVVVRGAGDATGDNRTDISDFAILAANFNLTNRTYVTGDFDLTGTTNISDFAILSANFNQTFLQRTSIPEPLLVAWSAMIPAMLRRRALSAGCRLQSAPKFPV